MTPREAAPYRERPQAGAPTLDIRPPVTGARARNAVRRGGRTGWRCEHYRDCLTRSRRLCDNRLWGAPGPSSTSTSKPPGDRTGRAATDATHDPCNPIEHR